MAHRTIFTYRECAPHARRPTLRGPRGDLVGLPVPSSDHQEVVGTLYAALREWAVRSAAGRVMVSPLDVKLSDTDVVRPDLLFVAAERLRIIESAYVRAGPDLVIEVLSPSSAGRDRMIKRAICDRHGVREYWIVDPDARAVEVLTYGADGLQLRRIEPADSALSSDLLPGFQLAVATIFQTLAQ